MDLIERLRLDARVVHRNISTYMTANGCHGCDHIEVGLLKLEPVYIKDRVVPVSGQLTFYVRRWGNEGYHHMEGLENFLQELREEYQKEVNSQTLGAIPLPRMKELEKGELHIKAPFKCDGRSSDLDMIRMKCMRSIVDISYAINKESTRRDLYQTLKGPQSS